MCQRLLRDCTVQDRELGATTAMLASASDMMDASACFCFIGISGTHSAEWHTGLAQVRQHRISKLCPLTQKDEQWDMA